MEGGWNKRREKNDADTEIQAHLGRRRAVQRGLEGEGARRDEGASLGKGEGLPSSNREGCYIDRQQQRSNNDGQRSKKENKILRGANKESPPISLRGGNGRGGASGRVRGEGEGGGGVRSDQNRKGLKLLYLNAQSILSKVVDLNATACDTEPDIILITESWCNENISNNVLKIDGYEIVNELRTDRADTTNGIGGGLLVYTKKGLKILPADKQNNFNQYLCFDVLTCTNEKVHIFLVYRPPSSNKENYDKLCEIIAKAPPNTLLVGDFNLPKIEWNSLTCDNYSSQFMNTCLDNNFSQYVNFVTHRKNNTLDLVLCNDESIISVDNLGPLSSSDHVMIMIETSYTTEQNKDSEEYLNWAKADYESIGQDISQVNWNRFLRAGNTEQKWNVFDRIISEIVEKNVPKCIAKQKGKPAWMNNNISRLRNKKARLYKKMKETGLPQHIEDYKKTTKELKKNCA